jgi:hypothetical protein
MVTECNIPYSFFNQDPFKNICGEMAEILNFTINSKNIQQSIHDFSDQVREAVKKELEGRIVSLKADIVSKYGQSVLGLNVQFVGDGELKIRTLGMVSLEERHTGEYIAEIVQKTIERFGLKVEQIYTFTTDNGANMLAAASILEKIQIENLASKIGKTFLKSI